MENIRCGLQSFVPEVPVYVENCSSVAGEFEKEGPLGEQFDLIMTDDPAGSGNWEEAESTFQQKAVELLLQKSGRESAEMRYILAGDLLGQCTASTFGLASFGVPFLGVYGACSTCGEALGLGSMILSGGIAESVVCVTSSHFGGAAREFRFPLEYGSQKPFSATRTVTGSAAFWLTTHPKRKPLARITGVTTGCIVDYGIKDPLNMGACMAPGAAAVIAAHFRDFHTEPADYDHIITGDLGVVGSRLLEDLLQERGYAMEGRHLDCGRIIYDTGRKETQSGGSGCGCCALTLAAHILKQFSYGNWKKILFVPTGALLSKVSANEGRTIPSVAHGVVLEKPKEHFSF